MAYQSLYRRFRPQRFSEVRGQDHLVAALQNALRDGRVGHAYLFSGPRGTGKTTSARILAKALNCTNLAADGEPCCVCEACTAVERGTSMDLVELDAASNNGVDSIRELVASASLGSPGLRKVYILDEVHMLSTAASNALLKTLEEPPSHVVFVLATTDPQKVLPTIRSRTQHVELSLIGATEMAEHVRDIASRAEIDVTDEIVDYVVRRGGGSARDTLSALDQVVAAGGIATERVPVDDLVEALIARNPAAALTAVAAAVSAGAEARELVEKLTRPCGICSWSSSTLRRPNCQKPASRCWPIRASGSGQPAPCEPSKPWAAHWSTPVRRPTLAWWSRLLSSRSLQGPRRSTSTLSWLESNDSRPNWRVPRCQHPRQVSLVRPHLHLHLQRRRPPQSPPGPPVLRRRLRPHPGLAGPAESAPLVQPFTKPPAASRRAHLSPRRHPLPPQRQAQRQAQRRLQLQLQLPRQPSLPLVEAPRRSPSCATNGPTRWPRHPRLLAPCSAAARSIRQLLVKSFATYPTP